MSFTEFMERTTNRQFQMMVEFLKMEWNQPSRSDNYLMLIAQEVRRVLSKDPAKITLSDFKLTFGTGNEKTPKMSREQRTAIAQNHWRSLLGMNDDG